MTEDEPVVRGRSRPRDGDRPTNLYYQPTVVDQVGTDTLINRDETFGPLLYVLAYDELDIFAPTPRPEETP